MHCLMDAYVWLYKDPNEELFPSQDETHLRAHKQCNLHW